VKPIIPNIPTIAVTGSAGKSTTTAFISSILKRKWKIIKTEKNRNLSDHTKRYASRITSSHKAVVLEMGLGRPGKRHFRYIRPNISVITNIGTAHFGKVGNSFKGTAKCKSVLIKYMQPQGTLLINKDDQYSKLLQTKNFKGKQITVGIKNKADYQASRIQYLDHGMKFNVTLDGKEQTFFIPTFGVHNVINALFAIAISHRLHFSTADMRIGLRTCKMPNRRLNVLRLPNQSILIDDTYNANPHSVKAATDVLTSLGKKKKKIVVLGSMLELGKHTIKGHKEVGQYLVKKNIDAIYTYGKNAQWIGRAAVNNGFPAQNVHHFENRSSLHKRLKKNVKPNRAFLVKGSNRMRMMKTADFLAKL
jgi:UDP-N-acetylmuramoyl-tripeptide--D-alanyl-D-alanine ligase